MTFSIPASQIKKMKSLREAGMSYRGIAKELNEREILTKTRKSRWSSKVVYQIVENVK